MNKKLLVSLFICFFVFSLGMIAKEKAKAKTIEHLAWAQTGGKPENMYFLYPAHPYTTREEFNSGPLLTLNVPASPESKALFFKCGHMVWLSGLQNRYYVER